MLTIILFITIAIAIDTVTAIISHQTYLHGIVDGLQVIGTLLRDALGRVVDEVALVRAQALVELLARRPRTLALVRRVAQALLRALRIRREVVIESCRRSYLQHDAEQQRGRQRQDPHPALLACLFASLLSRD